LGDDEEFREGITTEWESEKTAIRAAETASKERLLGMSLGDPAQRRYRAFSGTDESGGGAPELRDLA